MARQNANVRRREAELRRVPEELRAFLEAFPPTISKLFLETRHVVLGAAPGASELIYNAYNWSCPVSVDGCRLGSSRLSTGRSGQRRSRTWPRLPVGNRPRHGVCFVIAALEVRRRPVAETRMTPMRVVPAFDELEHRDLRLGLVLEAPPLEQLAFQRREEALGDRVVVGIADRSHRGAYTHLPAAQPEGDRGVLRALIGMMDDIARSALRKGAIECIEHKLGSQVARHRPADHATTEDIE